MARPALQLMGIRHPSEATAGFGFSMAGMDIIDARWVHPVRKVRDLRKDRIFWAFLGSFVALYVLALAAGMSCRSCLP